MSNDRRKSLLRRDLNDLIRGADGKVSEAKVGILAFKVLLYYTFIQQTAFILDHWEIFMIFITIFLAPDLLKRILETRAGIKEMETKQKEEK